MLGEFEQVLLLAILRIGENAYGIPIRDEIRDCTGRDVTLGAIYKTLGRLAEKGFVTATTGAPTPVRGGRRTRCYSVTAAGRRSIRESVRGLRKLTAGLDLRFDAR
ncbi:MAG TPA: helix-turn-helix transcriptional regulator [Gemmatimonadaceae bacterium]|nr:helix-turn-helix transcriptional regulator [Gemmatimonadaceae bacterium]